MTIEKKEYSELKAGDKVIIQNHNRKCGALIFVQRIGKLIQWETTDGEEAWDDIDFLKDSKVKLLGIVKD